MNRIFLIITGIFLFSYQGIAQTDIAVLTQSTPIGKNIITGEPIVANEYTFPERIQDFKVDTANKYLTIQLRGISKNGKWLENKGSVIRYDTERKKVLWSEKIAFQMASIQQYGSVTLRTTGGKSYCLNNESGESLWEVKNSIILADPIAKIGIGYKIQAVKGRENMLEGIDLTNGQPIWQRKISGDYGWNDVFYLSDSTLLIGASGLHTLNIFNGTGWDYNTVTGKKDYTASAVGTGLGIAAGLLTGTYAVSTGHNLIRDVNSNVLKDSLNFYFASKEHLVKLNRNGKVLWQKSLPADLTSKSWLFKSGDNLIMINRGYAYMGSRQLDFGTPFIASFDMDTGDQKYLKAVTNEKKDPVKGSNQKNGELLFVFSDHISRYSTSSGQLINDQKFNIEEYGELSYFIGEQVFVKRDSSFFSLPKLDTTKHYVQTKSGRVLVLNSDLKIDSEMSTENFYIYYLLRNGKKFIAKGNQTYVIDIKGKKLAELAASSRSTLLNGKLYDAQEKSFLEINLEKIIE